MLYDCTNGTCLSSSINIYISNFSIFSNMPGQEGVTYIGAGNIVYVNIYMLVLRLHAGIYLHK